MTSTAVQKPQYVAILGILLGIGGGCRDVQSDSSAPVIDDPPATCTADTDCLGGTCVAGLCRASAVLSCSSDQECADMNQVCHPGRFFCVDCYETEHCAAQEVCQFDFTCIASTDGDEACTDACDDRSACGDDQVCKDGACCAPPRRCQSDADCPANAPLCNGATGQCFGGQGCFEDADCATQPGCAGNGCACVVDAAPPGVCRVRTDACASDRDCWEGDNFAGKFCTLDLSPTRCADAPTCATDAQCANQGLVCDTDMNSPSYGYCGHGAACEGDEACGEGRTCEDGRCVVRSCQNDPDLCGPSEICDPVSRTCVPAMSGSCSQDEDCAAGYWCQLDTGTCAVGCRNNDDCPDGVCNPSHVCEFASGQLCGPCTDDLDCPANSRCVDIPVFGKTCSEICSLILGIECSDPSAACVLSACSCL